MKLFWSESESENRDEERRGAEGTHRIDVCAVDVDKKPDGLDPGFPHCCE